MALIGNSNAEKIWNYLKEKGFNDYACAGIIGNMDAESGLNPKNIEDSYEASLGFGDDEYVARVDSGEYTKSQFVNDSVGVFICQWTWHTRKQALYEFIKARGKSVGDLESQLDFFYKELTEIFQQVLQALMRVNAVREASDIILLKFECPADQSLAMQNKRASLSQVYYDRFGGDKMGNSVGTPTTINGYYKIQKGANIKLSEHFSSSEFDCHGSVCCAYTFINEQLVKFLEKIRVHFGKPITITSGYRCEVHNKNVGGATGSRHSSGDAADIVVAGVSPAEVAKYAESIGIKGIGLYETDADGHFVHIDTRTTKSFWYGQAQAYRSTFGGSAATIQPAQQPTQQQSKNYISYGDVGENVKSLQEKLIKLGYSCGASGADGSFGLGTKNAVVAFQKANKLTQDGIVGALTMAAIDKAVNKLVKGSKEVVVTADLLNVRAGAGMNFKVVATVAKGSTLIITQEKDGWGKFNTGWVSMQYVRQKG